ncbi:MAG: hypothetical protein JXA90_07190, partial [Planctomycetes bacterium]|nr:hypothetical protein [Planctomycetota bacterium]
AEEKDPEDLAALDVTETEKPTEYSVPVAIDDPQHQRHLENFFAAVRGEARLRCPGEIGLAALVSARKAMESAAAGGKVALEARDFAL